MSSGVTNLFIDKSQRPNQDEQGLINIGKNCQYCNQLDFLPFICEFCKKTFCSQHRTIEQHQCIAKNKFFNQHKSRSSSPDESDNGGGGGGGTIISSKSLFPDRNADKRKLEAKLNSINPIRPTTIKETQFRVGDVSISGSSNAFKKFQKFLTNQKKNKKSGTTNGGNSITSKLFGGKSSKTSSNNKFIDIANLKKNAKGDNKIIMNDRIYIWCIYVENPDLQISIDKDKKPVFISKNWVVGRSLDSIADNLHIQNKNNVTNESLEKLNIFKLEDNNGSSGVDGEPKLISTSLKSTVFKTGDTIYLVRGTI